MTDTIKWVQRKKIAIIDESNCIGCTKCINVCPVDAILGASKHMHVILTSECIGCGLCLPPCPVDCIKILTEPDDASEGKKDTLYWRQRVKNRRARLDSQEKTNNKTLISSALNTKQAFINAALARAKSKKINSSKNPTNSK